MLKGLTDRHSTAHFVTFHLSDHIRLQTLALDVIEQDGRQIIVNEQFPLDEDICTE
jgi:hypothetical protein